MLKNILKTLSLLIFLAVALTGFVYLKYKSVITSNIGNNPEKKVFVITEGLSGYQVLDKLESEEIINSTQKLALKIYMKYEKQPKFQNGTYKIPLNVNLAQLMDVLETPELTDIWVTIPEGLRKDEIATRIAKEYEDVNGAAFSKNEFLTLTEDKDYIKNTLGLSSVTNLEGYLYPDKYLLPAQATTDYIIQTLVNTFKKKAGEISYKQLIVASMLEREGLSDKDRPMIADVIYKRLNEGWLLQIDATLLYYYKDWKHVITVQDKEKDQPYNTYAKPGLTPTPICNPGVSSITAAKNPKSNTYYYYIHDNNGNVYFAKTLAEHEANIAKYLR